MKGCSWWDVLRGNVSQRKFNVH